MTTSDGSFSATLDAGCALPRGAIVTTAAGLGVSFVIIAAFNGTSWRASALALVGLGLGFVLFQSTFGFAGSFRAALDKHDFSGFRLQAIVLALSSIVFFALLGFGSLFGVPLNGFAAPIGFSLIIGAGGGSLHCRPQRRRIFWAGR
jgi:uncharacterized protein